MVRTKPNFYITVATLKDSCLNLVQTSFQVFLGALNLVRTSAQDIGRSENLVCTSSRVLIWSDNPREHYH